MPTNTPINARSPIAPQQAPKSNNENTAPSPTRPRRQSLSLSFGAAQPSPTSAHHAEADHAPSAAAASQPSASRGAAPADNNVQIHLIADAEILLPFLDRPAEVRELLFDTPANASLTSRLCRTFGGDPERPQLTGVSDEWSTLLGLLCDTHREDVDDNAWLVKLRSTIKPRSHELWALTQRCLAADGIKINDEADMPSQSSFDTWAAFDLDDNAVDDEDSDDHAGWFASSSRDHRDDDLQQPSAVEIQAVHALPTSYHNTPAGQLHQECLSSRNADDVCRALSPFSDTDFGAHLNDPVLPAERISPGMFPMSHPKDDPYISLCETHSLMDIQEEPSVEKDGQDVPRHEFSLRSPLVGQGRRRRSSTNISSPIHRPDELEEFMHNTSGRFAGLRLCTGGQDHRSRRSVGSASHSRTSSSSSLNMAGSEPSMDNALDSSSQPQGVKGDTHQGVTFSRHRRLSNLILTPASPPQGPSYPAQPLSSADVNASAAQQTWPRSTGFPCRDSPSSSAAIGSQPSQPSLARRMGDHIDASPFKRHRRATSAGFAPESLSQPTEGKRLEQRRRLSFARSFAELAITPPQARVQPSPGRPAERARAVSVPSCPAEEAVACEATGAPKKASLGLMRDGRTRHPSAGHRAGSPSRAAFRASLGLSPSESAFDIAGGRSMTQVTSPDSGGSSPEGRRSPHSVSPRTVALPEESASGAATPLGDTATPMPTVPGLGTSYFGPKSQEVSCTSVLCLREIITFELLINPPALFQSVHCSSERPFPVKALHPLTVNNATARLSSAEV